MSGLSKIEWTESTWNPVTGCTKVSSGCKNCYAERMTARLKHMGLEKYANGFDVTLHGECLNDPYKWKKPSTIFVNSMSDIYHSEVPLEFIQKIFTTMNENPQHTFQLLTKRPERMAELASELNWTPNIWQGVSVENEKHADRITLLKEVPAQIRFISFEPLIGCVGSIELDGIDWAIVGGESGPHSRPIESDWVLNIKKQCEDQGVLFNFKQWGGFNKKKTGRNLLGRTWDAIPSREPIAV